MKTITAKKAPDFVIKNIVCRYSLPHKIVSDNGKQFDCEEFTDFCNRHGVVKSFSAVARPQTNGQAEAVSKILKVTLKKKLLACKNNWPEELPRVLWAYRTTPRTTTGHSPFSMAYGCEAMVPVETLFPSHRRTTYDPATNQALLQEALDQVEELRDESQIRMAAYQKKVTKYFNSKVKNRKFAIGDMVLRRVFPATQEPGVGVLGPN